MGQNAADKAVKTRVIFNGYGLNQLQHLRVCRVVMHDHIEIQPCECRLQLVCQKQEPEGRKIYG